MRALRFSQHGGPDVLSMSDVPVPRPGSGEVLVRVRAAGVNPVDAGLLTHPLRFVSDLRLPATPGWDVAGTVTEMGPATTGFEPGDEVFGLSRFPRLGPGTFAEYTAVPAADLAGKPAELPWDKAGALPLVALTALQAFDAVGGVTTGTRILIEAAAGGVGHVASQIATAAGATVAGTGSAPRHEFMRAHGVAEPIDYTTTSDVLAAAAPVHGVVVSTSTDMLRRAAEAVEAGGFLISIRPDITPDIAAIADRRGVRHADFLVAADGAGMRRIAGLVAGHELDVHVDHAYELSEAKAAYEQVAARHTVGKVVLLP
jgi:NADPH:quinone reductase-like Zn-dependent oxidoreductase